MKKYLLVASILSMAGSAFAGNGGVGSVGGGTLSCTGIDPDSKQVIHVAVNATDKTITVNGQTSSVQIAQGPEQFTLMIVNESTFMGLETKKFKSAKLYTKTIDEVVLTCDGTPL